MIRVLFLNRSYFPDAEATGQLLTELCEDLASTMAVSVIVGQPNSNPSNADFRRYGRQTVNGVTVRRVWHTRFNKRSFVGRALNLVTFTISATLAGLFGPRPDVVVTETDPPLLCLVGRLLALRFRCRFVAYLQDIHPELGIALGKLKKRRWTRMLQRMFHAAYRRADRVVVLSRDMRRYMQRIGVASDRITTIANWVDTQRIVPVKEDNPLRLEWKIEDGRFLVMYSGNLGICQDLSTILDAADLLRPHKHIQFLLIGNGVSRQQLIDQTATRKLDSVQFADYQPLSRLHQSLSAADLHLVPVEQRAIDYLMPSKLYGILASGTPLVAITRKNSELANLVEEENVGVSSSPGDAQSLADQILWFSQWCPDRESYGTRARELAVTRFDRRHSIAQFAQVLNEITDQKSTPASDPSDKPHPAASSPEPHPDPLFELPINSLSQVSPQNHPKPESAIPNS